jgi:hypothetical protein
MIERLHQKRSVMDAKSNVVLGEVVYPESGGKPMAENTLQWDWMVKIIEELRIQFKGQSVFVAGNLFWYPVQGDPTTVAAPHAMVVFGRPAGYRGSYRQWEEDGIAPQVVFEVFSPNSTREEMYLKLCWYEKYGVEEYYLIDPHSNQLQGWARRGEYLKSVYPLTGFTSPRLKVRFDVVGEVVLYTPEGRPFQNRDEHVLDLKKQLEAIKALSRETLSPQ